MGLEAPVISYCTFCIRLVPFNLIPRRLGHRIERFDYSEIKEVKT
jgi:hypothetical protein